MFEYYENILCVRGAWLDEVGVTTISNLKFLSCKDKIKKARSGRGLGNYALYVYESLPQRFRNVIEHDLGIDPYEESKTIDFSKYLKQSETVAAFFSNYELEDERYLSEVSLEAVNEYTANANVLNAIKVLHAKVTSANPKINKGELWGRFAKSITNLSKDVKKRYPCDLPTNPRALRAKYEACILEKPNKRYQRVGLEGLIHENWLNNNSRKITPEIGEWLLAFYCIPIKHSFKEVWKNYNKVRCERGWTNLSVSGITNFLMQPEKERFWTLPREGEDAYTRKYGHTMSKDKERLFPSAHWSIDGTKLDAVHYWDTTSKMAAVCKINVVIDVYSEKIIGYSFSMTENHIDHFIAVKMAVNNTGEQPYLFTYDAQSAHRSKRMQQLYSKVIAKGGQHYHHKVGRKSNPIEQVFNRLQQQVISKRWFTDGQSIKSKQNRSKANLDFLHENKGALPNFEELERHWQLMVAEWNGNIRSEKTTKTRNEYFESKRTFHSPIDVMKQVSMFWIDETKPKKYHPHGMPLTVAGHDYLFEVYNADGEVDLDFRYKYVQQKLIVSYDPDYLEDYVALYKLNDKEEKVFVGYAQKKRRYVEVAKLQKEGEYDQMLKDLEVREKEKSYDWQEYLKLAERTGVTREALIEEQNSWVADNNNEFNSKRAAYATKEENLTSDSSSLFDKIINN